MLWLWFGICGFDAMLRGQAIVPTWIVSSVRVSRFHLPARHTSYIEQHYDLLLMSPWNSIEQTDDPEMISSKKIRRFQWNRLETNDRQRGSKITKIRDLYICHDA